MTLKIKKIERDAILPRYSGPNEAGMDLYSYDSLTIKPQERVLIRTGISMAIPQNHVGLIWDRSGIASKHGLKTMGGVIDSTYRGEIKIIIHNLSNQVFLIEKGMRIAQMLIQPIVQKEIQEVNSLEESERRDKGFGSSGFY